MCICSYLYSALCSGFISTDRFRSMITDYIEITPADLIPDWVWDLSLLTEKAEMLDLLYKYSYYEEDYNSKHDYSLQNVIVGYYYRMYMDNTIEMACFLEMSSSMCDWMEDFAALRQCKDRQKIDAALAAECSGCMYEAQRQFGLICSFMKNEITDT